MKDNCRQTNTKTVNKNNFNSNNVSVKVVTKNLLQMKT